MKSKFLSLHIDAIGFSASLLCALHCALLPFVLSILPLTGLQFLENPIIEYSFIALSLALASTSLIKSYLKYHKDSFPLKLLFDGFILILVGRFLDSEAAEATVTALGGVSIALAHYINWSYNQDCKNCKK